MSILKIRQFSWFPGFLLKLGLDRALLEWEIPTVKTLRVHAHKRIRIPDAQPRQVFAYERTGDGRRILTEIKAETTEPFPPGSLRKYVTAERDAEMLELVNLTGNQ